MADNGEGISEFVDPSGHAPVFSKKRKTATRAKVKTQSRPGGVSTLQSMFQPPESTEPSPSKGSTAPGFGELPTRPARGETGKDDGTKEVEMSDLKDAVDEEADIPLKEYSNEARVYHGRYAELSQAHDEARFDYCRNGCLDLLTEPNLPRYTRIQTLQMVSTLMKPAAAEDFLKEAGSILDEMDGAKFQVQLLKEDNENMMNDINIWRGKKGLTGKDIDGADSDDEPTPEWFDFDRQLEEKMHQDTQEELEPFGEQLPAPEQSVNISKALKGTAESDALPPSPPEDTGMLSPSEEDDDL